MDNEQARFILQAYRPNGQDASDPQFREALEQVKRDPDLARWFEDQRALDTAIAAKLKEVPVPADLKATILAGRKVIRPSLWSHRRELLAVAATVLLLLALGAFWLRQTTAPTSASFAAFHTDMTRFLDNIGFLEFQDKDLVKVKHWLASRKGHADFVLPAKLQGQPCMGCRVLDWHGQKVTLVCYYLKPGNSEKVEELHLLVIDRGVLQNPPPDDGPQFNARGRWATASWSDQRHSYVLAGLATEGYLKKYL